MKKRLSFFQKIILSIGIPVLLLFSVVCVLLVYLNGANAEHYGIARSDEIIIIGLGLAGILLVIILSAKRMSKKITKLEEITRQLEAGMTGELVNENVPKDQLDEIIQTCAGIAETKKNNELQAKKLAIGDFSVECEVQTQQDNLGIYLNSIKNSLLSLENEINMVLYQVKTGDFSKRISSEHLSDGYKNIATQMNHIINTMAEKCDWYVAILDAIPFPVQVMNNDLKWTFMNKVYADFLVAIGLGKDREAFCGMDCASVNAEICGTENCSVKRLVEQGLTSTPFEANGRHFRNDTAYVINKQGEKIGFMEFNSDLTPSAKVDLYLRKEVERIAKNLQLLADGDLNLNNQVTEADEYTVEVHDYFEQEIEKSLRVVKQNIESLINDATMMTTAAIDGQLEMRADVNKFNGAWKDMISGMNQILMEIEKPLLEVGETIQSMSSGNLNVEVTGAYRGGFDQLKQMINGMVSQLNAMIRDISYRIGELAKGNLNIENAQSYNGDFENISSALNSIIESLNPVMRNIYDSAEHVNTGANQVADGSQALAQGSTEQASAIQELTASITEIADQTKNNAVDANQARELTTAVMDNAIKGNAHMNAMQQSMVDINTSSQDISKIIKVIDDIAFQTNILALNAAVEAARAGQHGKGFAVVAEEVRTLAARSSDAAKETTFLIEGSINKVRTGTKIADETADALTEIVTGIEKVTVLVSNIAVASNEQATGIAQINTGIEQVAQVVQQNSATAEQSAAASEEMSSQAELLKERINQFRLREV